MERSILVFHDDLMTKGGAGAVCMNTLEALQDPFDVTLLTTGELKLEELNQYYSTNVSNITIRRNQGLETFFAALRLAPGPDLIQLQRSLYFRRFSNLFSSYDLVISTKNELGIACNSIEYVHFPHGIKGYPKRVTAFYKGLCELVAPDKSTAHQTDYFTNSEWTADIVTERLGAPVSVLYPPVCTNDLNPKPWTDRKERILTAGRITPDKRIIQNIKIMSRLRERGHEIHYDIVGPSQNSKSGQKYLEKVKNHADQRKFVTYHGEIPRTELVKMLTNNKYGIHGKTNEHFGIAVAEMVAGGMIPFVPQGGGQREIVGYTDEVLYKSVQEAVEKMDHVLSEETIQYQVRNKLPDIEAKFGRQRFQEQMRKLVRHRMDIPDIGTDGVSRI